ncbi:MAG: thioredoxin domain-containing protein [Myxococcota bacterium]
MKRLILAALSASLPLILSCKPATTGTESKGQGAGAASKSTAGGARMDPGTVVAEWNGGKLTYGELLQKKDASFKKLYNKYMTDLYAAEQREVEGFVLESLVTKAAAAAGKSEQEYMQGLAGTPSVTEDDMKKFYDEQVKASGQPYEAVKERIQQYLVGMKQRDAMKAAVDKIKADAKVKISIPPPDTAKATFALAGHPSKGPDNAKVTIVEFSDFQCPYCSRAVPGVHKLLEQFPNDVKIYFLHFPLNFHEKAMPSALAAQCANAQGKFWEFHDKLFENQGSLGPELFEKTAGEVGMDVAKFKSCQSDPATAEFVKKDMEQAEAAGVEGTPSFYVNGVPTSAGVPTPEQIKALL